MNPFFFEERTRDAAGRRAVLRSMMPKLEAFELGGDMGVQEAEERVDVLSRMSWTVEVVALRAKGAREKAEIQSVQDRIMAASKELRRSIRASRTG